MPWKAWTETLGSTLGKLKQKVASHQPSDPEAAPAEEGEEHAAAGGPAASKSMQLQRQGSTEAVAYQVLSSAEGTGPVEPATAPAPPPGEGSWDDVLGSWDEAEQPLLGAAEAGGKGEGAAEEALRRAPMLDWAGSVLAKRQTSWMSEWPA